MERVRLIYEQLEEAKRLLATGSLLNLRLSLILLDNAAEVLMFRELEHVFQWDDSMTPKWEPAKSEYLKSELGPKYTEEERSRARSEFEAQLRILAFRLRRISSDDRQILTICHKMRCEAFHKAYLRPEILLPTTRLLFHTVAELTVKLPFRSYSVSGSKLSAENEAFMKRFDLKQSHSLGTAESLGLMRSKLIDAIPRDIAGLSEALSEELVERIDQTIGGLAYVGNTSDEKMIDYNLKFQQFWLRDGVKLAESGVREPALTEAFAKWEAEGNAEYTIKKLKKWQKIAGNIRKLTNPARALQIYWSIESRFSALERDVDEAVFRFDEDINMRI
jgi:hypothetical protein